MTSQDGVGTLPIPSMQPRSIPWFWIAIGALLLLAPGPAGRLLMDVLGGLTLTLLLLPLLLAVAGFVGWQIFRSRLRTCQACGFSSMGGEICPACGTPYCIDVGGSTSTGSGAPNAWAPGRVEIEASEVIIDVQATDVSQGSKHGE